MAVADLYRADPMKIYHLHKLTGAASAATRFAFAAALAALLLPFPARAHFPPDFESPLEIIAFGSCNRQNLPQPLWEVIAAREPDLWIWCGDNIYGDSREAEVLEEKYRQQFERPEYAAFRERFPVIGTWDDHDYGENNAGADYPLKEIAAELALDFMEVPSDDPRRAREGIHGAYSFGPEGRRVKVLLIDDRFFAVNPKKPGADLLGPAQQAWLEKELRETDAQINLLVSGIQVLPAEHGWEKWANFPASREWLLALLKEHPVPGLFLLSGDRHIHEISLLEGAGPGGDLVEITSSGLTHSWEDFPGEPNRLRRGPIHRGKGFGLIQIDWEADPVRVTAAIIDTENSPVNALAAMVDGAGRVVVENPASDESLPTSGETAVAVPLPGE